MGWGHYQWVRRWLISPTFAWKVLLRWEHGMVEDVEDFKVLFCLSCLHFSTLSCHLHIGGSCREQNPTLGSIWSCLLLWWWINVEGLQWYLHIVFKSFSLATTKPLTVLKLSKQKLLGHSVVCHAGYVKIDVKQIEGRNFLAMLQELKFCRHWGGLKITYEESLWLVLIKFIALTCVCAYIK